MGSTEAGAFSVNVQFSQRLVDTLGRARSVVAFTGAGVSAESGVPTFRGDDGIWKKFKPEDLANISAFMRNPDLVWEWYSHRRKIIAGIRPNAGHYALAQLEKLLPHFTVITQNIDNLHRRAGSKTVYELHGNIERNYCMKCGALHNGEEIPTQQGVPHCLQCGGLIRPDVVWFGELLPEDEWGCSVRAAEGADVFLSIGTSGVVYPAASIPITAKRHGAYLIEINPEATPLTGSVDEFLRGQSGQILPALYERLASEHTHHHQG
jgi:NAD-dependent deacetylase